MNKLKTTQEYQNNIEVFKLSSECSIYDVAELKQQLLTMINATKNINIDLSAVTSLDAAIVQLLISTKLELEIQGLNFNITSISTEAKKFISSIYCDELYAESL